jgi:hypothetical protein
MRVRADPKTSHLSLFVPLVGVGTLERSAAANDRT